MKKFIASFAVLGLFLLPVAAFADSSVTASAGTGASISPSGLTVVPTGTTQAFSIGASQGYKITSVSVDGSDVGTPGEVDFTGVDGDTVDHTIDVSAGSMGGGTLPYCSGPMAPGWNVSLPGGGCGGTEVWIASGATYTSASTSKLPGAAVTTETCPAFFPSGCMVKQ